MTKAQLERTYGVHIVDDSYFNGFDRYVKSYAIYSADGCRWDAGFRTIRKVEEECKRWSKQLLAIKNHK